MSVMLMAPTDPKACITIKWTSQRPEAGANASLQLRKMMEHVLVTPSKR